MGFITRVAAYESDKLCTQKIQNFVGHKIAESEHGSVYAEQSELNGFKFIRFFIIGPYEFDTKDGCLVRLSHTDGDLTLESDNMEILSDVSYTLQLGLTEVEIDVEDALIALGKNGAIHSITFQFYGAEYPYTLTDVVHLEKLINS